MKSSAKFMTMAKRFSPGLLRADRRDCRLFTRGAALAPQFCMI